MVNDYGQVCHGVSWSWGRVAEEKMCIEILVALGLYRVQKATGQTHHTFSAHVGGILETHQLFGFLQIVLQPCPAPLPVNAIFAQRIYRASFKTLEAFLTTFVEAQLPFGDQGCVVEICLGHQAAQPACAACWRDELSVHSNPSEAT